MRKRLEFLREGFLRQRDVGSIVPASRALGQELTRFIPRDRPCRVLEVGPGTGPVTERVLAAVGKGSLVQLVEMNPAFCETLREKYLREPKADVKIALFEWPLQSLETSEPFDVIVSSLPHNNFGEDLLKVIFERYRALLRAGGTLSFYEYWGMRSLRFLWPGAARRRQMAGVNRFFEATVAPVTFKRKLVFGNLPPALVHHIWGPGR